MGIVDFLLGRPQQPTTRLAQGLANGINSRGFRQDRPALVHDNGPGFGENFNQTAQSFAMPIMAAQQNLHPSFFDNNAPIDEMSDPVARDFGPRGELYGRRPPAGYAAHPMTGEIYAVDEGTNVQDFGGMPEGMTTESDRIGNLAALAQTGAAAFLDPLGGGGNALMAGNAIRKGAKYDRNIMNMNVYQGGPNKYGPEGASKSLEHMGKGEGAQAYGWGRYDAEAKSVGEQYQRALRFEQPQQVDTPEEYTLDALNYFDGNIETARASIKETAAMDNAVAAPMAKQALDIFDDVVNARQGNLYKHDLPDEAIAKYLDWDKPLSEQPESVRAALSVLKSDPIEVVPDGKSFSVRNAKTGEILSDGWANRADADRFAQAGHSNEWANQTGEDYYNKMVSQPHMIPGFKVGMDAQQAASEALGGMGIPGLRYKDGMSRGTDAGTSNFVTWDQDVLDRMKLLERNGEQY